VRRWWDSIAATIAITVIVAMVLGFGLRTAVTSGLPYLGLPTERVAAGNNLRLREQLPGKVAALIDILNKAPDATRDAIIAAVERPAFQIEILDAPIPNLMNGSYPSTILLHREIITTITNPRPVIVAERFSPADQPASIQGRGPKKDLLIETSLADGKWVLFTSRLMPPPVTDPVADRFSRISLTVWLILTVLLGLLLSVLAARRVTGPLSELATAAEQLGGSGDAPSITPNGPQEVQRTIKAFNRMQERLRRFDDDRTRMIAAMYHDLRTPLTRLRLRVELVEDPEQQQRMFAEIDHVGAMIDSILSFVREDAKREPRSLVDLSALIEGICEDAADAGQPVTFSGPRGITIHCRPTALRRAFSNIIDNALKYGQKAEVSLAPEAEYVVITVEDEGPGILRSEREKVFEPFYRLESSRNSDTGGVGLGLSVTRSIIREHGGDIELANRKGGGLSVRAELPAIPTSSRTNDVAPSHSGSSED